MLTSDKLFLFLFTGCALLVGWGILRSTPPQELFESSDKVAHFIAFAALSFTGRLAFRQMTAYIYWPVMTVLAFSMEYLQGQLQVTRFSSIEDAIANILGVVAVLAVFLIYDHINHRNAES